MRRVLLFLCAICSFGQTGLASTAFHDAFVAYSKVRLLEQQLKLLPYSASEDQESAAQKISAELTAARIDFHAVARIEGSELTPWEKQVLARVTKAKGAPSKSDGKETLDFLTQNFPQAQNFSLTEWAVIREWFGKEAEEAFFKTTYSARRLPEPTDDKSPATVVWIRAYGGQRTLAEKSSIPKEIQEMKKLLAAGGYQLEIVELSPFAKADDLAAELIQALNQRKMGPAILLTQNEAGAALYHALDTYPGLRKKESILGWINLNGKLYGEPPPASRAPASLSGNPMEASAAAAKSEAYRLYGENMQRLPPLVSGFPIVNVLSLEGPHRVKGSLRESVVPEGSTWLAPPGQPTQALPSALSLISGGHGKESFRDNVSEPGF